MTALIFVACVGVGTCVGVFVACIGGGEATDDDVLFGFAFSSFGFLGVVGLLGFRDVVAGVVIDVVVGVVVGVVAVGVLLLVVVSVVVEVGQRRGAQVPAHLRAISPLAPRTLRWVRGLLPGDEGAAWLAEVTSCLSEARDKGERRRYVRSYRRGVPRLIWNSWVLHLGGSQSRTLS